MVIYEISLLFLVLPLVFHNYITTYASLIFPAIVVVVCTL